MKERTFYTINLDSRRIIIIGIIFALCMAYSFFLGRTLGKKQAIQSLASTTELPKETVEEAKSEKAPIKTEEEIAHAEESSNNKAEVIELGKPSKTVAENPEKEPEPKKETKPVTPVANTSKPAAVIKKKPLLATVPSAKKTEEVVEKGFLTIQLGAFGSYEQAAKYREKVLNVNKSVTKYSPSILKKQELYVVQMARSMSREELEKIKKTLDPSIQISAMIVKKEK
jgi:SPOR domain